MKGNMRRPYFLARPFDYADDVERVLALIDRHGDVETLAAKIASARFTSCSFSFVSANFTSMSIVPPLFRFARR
jgi:hypothetical protein